MGKRKILKRGLALGLCMALGISSGSAFIADTHDGITVSAAEDLNLQISEKQEDIPDLKNESYSRPKLMADIGIQAFADDDAPLDTTPVDHFFEDHTRQIKATKSTIRVYANGGTITDPETNIKTDTKKCILYTDIIPSYLYTVNEKTGVVKPSTGKVAVGITMSDEMPDAAKGKIVDKEAAKIATASIKSGQITVTAKQQPGTVYLWAIDTGEIGTAACCPVTVKVSPSAANLYEIPDTDSDFEYGKTKPYKKGEINVGETVKMYVYPYYKAGKEVAKVSNAVYTAHVDAKNQDYFSVVQSQNNPHCFEVSALKLKDGKKVSGKIEFVCSQNGKKVAFQASAVNRVTRITVGNTEGLDRRSDQDLAITVSESEKKTGTFQVVPECRVPDEKTTDSLRFYPMGSQDGYDAEKLAQGKVQVTAKKSKEQGMISMKLGSDKETVTVTAAKKTPAGVTAYFLLVYNTDSSNGKSGYSVISVSTQ